MANRWGNNRNSGTFCFLGLQDHCGWWLQLLKKKKKFAPWKKSYDKDRHCVKEQKHHFASQALASQSYGFSSSPVWKWELNHKEVWALKNWCFWAVVLEKTLESLLDSKEINTVNIKRNQPWVFIGRTDTEAEVPILWPSDAKSWLTGKNLMLGKTESKRTREWQRVRCLNWLKGPELANSGR